MKCDAANPKASGPVNIWQETFPVRFGAIDRSDRLTLNAALQFFQEAAICHAENLLVGREDMARTGQVWILSRMSVMADRRPKYGETITVRSWPRGGEKLFAIRDYDIRDKDDIPVVSARSGWLIVDIEKRRPLRPQSVMGSLPGNEGLNALTSGPAGLEERGILQTDVSSGANPLCVKTERRALYNDVDYNGHVNNVSYIKWIEDVIDPRCLEQAEKMRLDINYMNEILAGETINLAYAPLETEDKNITAFAFEGRKTENSQSAAPTGSAAPAGCAFRAELRLWV
ncbi:MAG: acyl-ACP thioesterase [Treponema sp.]|jgi:acyl-ACP thioesterase|nr:acyl-ACP thioesterase [Treponema sp.]